MIDLCQGCGIELDFDPADEEIYDYVDSLCEQCAVSACCDDGDGDNYSVGITDAAYAELMTMIEITCE